MATTPPMFTTGISTLLPASTYPDFLLINNAGQGLNNTASQVQDGLGNRTNMSISSNYINFDRSVSQFQLDGVALTASAATLNNVSDVANGQYVLLNPNDQLTNASVLSANNGISLTLGAGSALIHVDPASPIGGIQQLGAGDNGILVAQNGVDFATVVLTGDSTIHILNPDGITGNPTFHVVDSTSLQWVNVALNGTVESKQSQLNFIPGPGAGINILDNPAANRTDITITATGSSSGPLTFYGAAYATTTADLGATYVNGAAGVGATLTNAGALVAFSTDGQDPPLGSVILVKDQTLPVQNGIYTLTTVGSGAVQWVLTRATDFDTPSEIVPGSTVVVIHGTLYASTGWIETDTVIAVGTSPITFVEFAVTGTVTSVTGTAGRITVANPTTTPIVNIDPTYVGQDTITTLGTIGTGVWQGTDIAVPHGGTGGGTFTINSLILGGAVNPTDPLQSLASGTAGNVLTSAGPNLLPQWLPAGAAASFVIPITQVAHGLVVGNVIRINLLGNYGSAQADTEANSASVVGIVIATPTPNTFTYQFGGIVDIFAGPLTIGATYYLDDVTAGNYVSVAPVALNHVQMPLFIALSATTGLWATKTSIVN